MTYTKSLMAIVAVAAILLAAGLINLQACLVHADRAALVALYNSTDGANWSINTNWLSDQPLENWYGVKTNSSGRVTILGFNNKNLTHLHLRSNNLTGTIPPELGNLNNLTDLWLRGNQLTGTIPLELGNLNRLERLFLSDNQLTGSLPHGFTELSALYKLNFQNNAGLCAPLDSDFQTWLQGVDDVTGDNCVNTIRSGATE